MGSLFSRRPTRSSREAVAAKEAEKDEARGAKAAAQNHTAEEEKPDLRAAPPGSQSGPASAETATNLGTGEEIQSAPR